MHNSHELYLALQRQNLPITERDPRWWPDSGQLKVLVGALLTQQSRWNKVEDSLANLESAGLLSIHGLANADPQVLIELIRPAGCFNAKSQRLISLSQAMLEEFNDFPNFCTQVDREWLLAQAGIGPETADAILCYGCYREAMVVDAYTLRLLAALGKPFDYPSAQQWLIKGIVARHDTFGAGSDDGSLALVYAWYHGMIVEYAKRHSRGKTVLVDALLKS